MSSRERGAEVDRIARVLVSIWPEAAQALGIGRTKMFELIQAGEIDTVWIGRRRLVPVDELHAFVARRRGKVSLTP